MPASDRPAIPQFNAAQRQAVIELIEACAWGDTDRDICSMESALRLALEATVEDFWRWENEALELRLGDEFSLSKEEVEGLTPEFRLAYVGRLLRSLALCYGVQTEFGGGPLAFEHHEGTPAALLRGLNDILAFPTTSTRHLSPD
jgi:hypothetical protein